MSDEYPPIHRLMPQVMAAIGHVSKGDWNEHQKFAFRGIDALHNAVYGPLCEHGVFICPEVLDAHYEEVQTSQGKPSRQATLTVRFRFYGPAGDHVDVVTVGEAMDSADKATNKAMAAAFKYALLQTFTIPTEGQDDADSQSPERGGEARRGSSRSGSTQARRSQGGRVATEKQTRFLTRLIDEHYPPEGCPWPLVDDNGELLQLSFDDVRRWIDELQGEPKTEKAARQSVSSTAAPNEEKF